MPVLPPNPPVTEIPPAPNTVLQVLTNALYEINVVAPGETPDATSEILPALAKFNQLLDSWSTRAEKIFVYDLISVSPVSGASFLLVPNLDPHTIGPDNFPPLSPVPTFALFGERPVRIKNINIILNNVSPVVRFPLHKRDKDWWSAN